ncbi:hypothetical protein Bbelb_349870 [Branchiostoma belcheri]|nr:hypothetical protein Bbelb_349870 [Branchiostoma belcheri]
MSFNAAQDFQTHVAGQHADVPVTGVREFDWVVLRVGKLHLEMNALKSFVDLNFDVWFSALAKRDGVQPGTVLTTIRVYMQLLEISIKGGTDEMLVAHVREKLERGEQCSISADNFLFQWAPRIRNPNFTFFQQQINVYALAIHNFRIGTRNNSNYIRIQAGIEVFSPLFSGRNHPKYQLIDMLDSMDRCLYPADLKTFIEKTESVKVLAETHRLHRRDNRLHRRDNRMHRRDNRLHRRDNRLHRRDNRLHRRDNRMHRRDNRLHRRDNRLHRRDNRLHRRDNRLHRRDNRLHRRDNKMHRRDNRMHRRDNRLHRRDNRLHRRDNKLHRRDNRLHRRDNRLHRRDNRLHRRDNKMHHRDNRMHRRDNRMHRRDNRMHRRDNRMHRRDNRLHRRDNRINRRDNKMHRRDNRLHRRDNRLHRRDNRLHRRDNRLHTSNISMVTESMGGTTGGNTHWKLPRGENQISDIIRKRGHTESRNKDPVKIHFADNDHLPNQQDPGYKLFVPRASHNSNGYSKKEPKRTSPTVNQCKAAQQGSLRTAEGPTAVCNVYQYGSRKPILLSKAVSAGYEDVPRRRGEPIERPKCVALYNKKIGGVDLGDAQLHMYLSERRTMKWSTKVALSLFGRAILNSYILYSFHTTQRPVLSRYNFMVATVEELAGYYYPPMKVQRRRRAEVVYKWDPVELTGQLISQNSLHLSFPDFRDFSHEKFQTLCILAGCDYLTSIFGIGVNKAAKFVGDIGDRNIFQEIYNLAATLRTGRQFPVPAGYPEGLRMAVDTFRHQTVYHPDEGYVPLTPYPPGVSAVDMDPLPDVPAANLTRTWATEQMLNTTDQSDFRFVCTDDSEDGSSSSSKPKHNLKSEPLTQASVVNIGTSFRWTIPCFPDYNGHLPNTLYLQLDNSAKECKNKYIIAFATWLVHLRIFRQAPTGCAAVIYERWGMTKPYAVRKPVPAKCNNYVHRRAAALLTQLCRLPKNGEPLKRTERQEENLQKMLAVTKTILCKTPVPIDKLKYDDVRSTVSAWVKALNPGSSQPKFGDPATRPVYRPEDGGKQG